MNSRTWVLWFGLAVFCIGAAEKPPVLLRVHLQAPEGSKGMISVPVTLLNPPETISIRSIPEVSEKEVNRVSTRADGTVLVEFDEFGKTKLEVGTSTGRGLIMVVIVNGRVVYAPRIDTTLTGGVLLLPTGAIFPDEIVQLNEKAGLDRSQKMEGLKR